VKVSLNLRPCDYPEQTSTFGELVEHVERECVPQGQVLTQIILDGRNLDQQEENESGTVPLEQIGSVEFFSARISEIVREGLSDATQLLPSLMEDLPVVAAELRHGEAAEGIEMFGQCIEVISWYVNLISRMDEFYRQSDPSFRMDPSATRGPDDFGLEADFTGLTLEDGPELRTFASFENLRSKLIDVEQAQAHDDLAEIADLIEFQILPIIDIWVREVPVFNAKVSREGGSA